MFIRKNKNRSGSVSVQIVQKNKRKNKFIKTVGVAHTQREEELFYLLAKTEAQISLKLESISNDHFQIVGSELILGKIYKKIGFPQGGSCAYFKSLVLCRLVYPGSKLKTVNYFRQHLNLDVSVYSIYRFLDELASGLKQEIEEISFNYTKKILRLHDEPARIHATRVERTGKKPCPLWC